MLVSASRLPSQPIPARWWSGGVCDWHAGGRNVHQDCWNVHFSTVRRRQRLHLQDCLQGQQTGRLIPKNYATNGQGNFWWNLRGNICSLSMGSVMRGVCGSWRLKTEHSYLKLWTQNWEPSWLRTDPDLDQVQLGDCMPWSVLSWQEHEQVSKALHPCDRSAPSALSKGWISHKSSSSLIKVNKSRSKAPAEEYFRKYIKLITFNYSCHKCHSL